MHPHSDTDLSLRFDHRFPATGGKGEARGSAFHLDVNLSLPVTGVTAIFGASGSGKTTVLRCVAGLQRADAGLCRLGDEHWQNDSDFLPVHRRQVGYVFQEPSLFDHLTVLGNLKFAVNRAWNKSAATGQLDHIVELMGLEKRLQHYPVQLSGGERQRVAIARAVLIQPRILLLDEPLAALDLEKKQEILPYLERLCEELQVPMLYVTHAVNEVARLADHLVLMDDGKAVASGSLNEVLTRLDLPVDLGEDAGVVIEARVEERDDRWHMMRVSFDSGEMWIGDDGHGIGETIRLRVLARDVSLALEPVSRSSIINRLPARISEIRQDTGAMEMVRLEMGSTTVLAKISQRSAFELELQQGKEVWAQIKSVAVIH